MNNLSVPSRTTESFDPKQLLSLPREDFWASFKPQPKHHTSREKWLMRQAPDLWRKPDVNLDKASPTYDLLSDGRGVVHASKHNNSSALCGRTHQLTPTRKERTATGNGRWYLPVPDTDNGRKFGPDSIAHSNLSKAQARAQCTCQACQVELADKARKTKGGKSK